MTKFRTAMTAVTMAALLTGSQAMAADGAMLAPGKPGGVHPAQHGSKLLWVGGAVLVTVIAVGIAVATTDNKSCTTACAAPTTTG
jgi:hypothetical protein